MGEMNEVGRLSRRTLAAACILASVAAAPRLACAEVKALPLRAEVQLVLDASAVAWSQGDLDGFMHCYEDAPSTTYLKRDGVVEGYKAIHDMYAARFGRNAASMGRLSMSLLNVRALGSDFALATGRYALRRAAAAGGDAGGLFTLVFHRSAAGWRVISDHTS